MIAQDARWISDALLSTSHYPGSAGAVALSLFGHSSRIVDEGGRFIRSAEPSTGLSALAALLPSEFTRGVAHQGSGRLIGERARNDRTRVAGRVPKLGRLSGCQSSAGASVALLIGSSAPWPRISRALPARETKVPSVPARRTSGSRSIAALNSVSFDASM